MKKVVIREIREKIGNRDFVQFGRSKYGYLFMYDVLKEFKQNYPTKHSHYPINEITGITNHFSIKFPRLITMKCAITVIFASDFLDILIDGFNLHFSYRLLLCELIFVNYKFP
jgi:hypothetical protein